MFRLHVLDELRPLEERYHGPGDRGRALAKFAHEGAYLQRLGGRGRAGPR